MSMCKAGDMFDRQQSVGLMTDEQIAERLGLSRARVFQLRIRAMAKIKAAILADDDLRDTAEELTGHRINKPDPCSTPDCETPYFDTQLVTKRLRGQTLDKFRLCRNCRSRSGVPVKVVQ